METNCQQCKTEMVATHKVEEYWQGETPFPEDRYYLICDNCCEKIEIMPWEYEYIRSVLGKIVN